MPGERDIIKLISCSFVVDYPASQKVQALTRGFILNRGRAMSWQRTQLSCWYSFLLGRTLHVPHSSFCPQVFHYAHRNSVSELRPLSYMVKACP